MKYASLLLLLLSGCGATNAQVREFLGTDIVRILETADRVEAIRVDGSLESRDSVEEKIGDYPITSVGPALSAEQIATLRGLIFDEANWQFDLAKACEFMPGVDYRFMVEDEQVDVLLCFSCDEWGFLHNGRMCIEDNDRARPALLRLARESFPDDAALRDLR